MVFDLKTGMNAEIKLQVKETDTAMSFGSGGVRVFATPMMIGLMENAALSAVDPHLPEGYATVGLHLDISHIAATPVGMNVTARAELIGIDGKKLSFKVEAFDDVEKIGEGTHQRYIIHLERLIEKSANKKVE